MVVGSTLASLGPRKSTYHGMPCELIWMPYGYVAPAPEGAGTIFISPLDGISRPTCPDCSVNQSVPFWSKIGVCGPRAAGSDFCTGNCVTLPVFGSSLPT